MDTLIISLVSVGCAVIGAIVGISTYKRNKDKEVKAETKDDTKEKVQMNAKLDVLLSNNTEIKGSVKDLGDKFDKFKEDFNTRLVRVEEWSKNIDKRIDNLEKKGKTK